MFTYRETTRLIRLLSEQLIPRARQSVDISTANYSSGKDEFLRLIENWKLLYELELELVEAKTRRELALAELELIIVSVQPEGAPFLKNEPVQMPEKKIKRK